MRAFFLTLLALSAIYDVAHCAYYAVLKGERRWKRDSFGRAVAMGGDVLAVGEHLGAYVFTRADNSTTLWNRIKLPWPPTWVKPVKGDGFGGAVAVGGSGGYVLVGGSSIAAYVYSSKNWTAPPFVLSDGTKKRSTTSFGAAVAATAAADVVAVGLGPPGCIKPPQCAPSRSSVRIFKRIYAIGTEKWAHTATLTPPDPKHQINFGYNVALSPDGSYLAAAAKGLPDCGYNGSLYIYSYESYISTWVLRQKLTCPDPNCLRTPYGKPAAKVAESFPSRVVAFTNDTLVVSHGDFTLSRGFIFTYRLTPTKKWVLNQTIGGQQGQQEQDGTGLAVVGDTLAEGGFYLEQRVPGTTQVVEYHRNGSPGAWDKWVPTRNLTEPPAAPAYFGEAVALDAATGAVIVGARNNDGSEHYLGVGPGAVYVFQPAQRAAEDNATAQEATDRPTSGASRHRLLFMP